MSQRRNSRTIQPRLNAKSFASATGSQRMGYLRRRDAVVRQRVRIWLGFELGEG